MTCPEALLLTASLQDPFEEYQKRLAERLARQDQSDEAMRRRAEAQAARDRDRITWLGTNLGVKGDSKVQKAEKKRKADEEGGVGKYLNGPAPVQHAPVGIKAAGIKTQHVSAAAAPPTEEFGVEKKKRKAGGGFGDFSGW